MLAESVAERIKTETPHRHRARLPSDNARSLKRTVPIAVRYGVAGLLNGDAHTAWFQTLGGRRPHAEFARFAPVSRASDSGIPVALPMAVAAVIQNGAKSAARLSASRRAT
jgi:hypothetical protein